MSLEQLILTLGMALGGLHDDDLHDRLIEVVRAGQLDREYLRLLVMKLDHVVQASRGAVREV